MKENYEKLEMNIIKFGEHEAVYMDINEGSVSSPDGDIDIDID